MPGVCLRTSAQRLSCRRGDDIMAHDGGLYGKNFSRFLNPDEREREGERERERERGEGTREREREREKDTRKMENVDIESKRTKKSRNPVRRKP